LSANYTTGPALCLAVRDVLRAMLGLTGTEAQMSLVCDLAMMGKPHPAAGQVFYGVHPGSWATQNGDYDLDEMMGVKVTVSMKLGTSPADRYLTALWMTPATGLDALARAAMLAVHRNQAVRLGANVYLGSTDLLDGSPNGFETELWFQGADGEPVPQGDEWFGTEPSVATQALKGMSVTLNFGLAERVQGIQGMT
jgi:hypothetical protein